MTSASQFLPAGPTPLSSEEWVEDYNEVRILGELDSTVRTAEQTEIGLFWTEHTGQQYARAFSYLVENYKLDVNDSARLMAIVWTGFADAVIGCWNAKFTYNFWRPVRAIRTCGGNSALSSDPDWTTPWYHTQSPGVSSRARMRDRVGVEFDPRLFPDTESTHRCRQPGLQRRRSRPHLRRYARPF